MERDLLIMIYGAIMGVVGSIVTSIVTAIFHFWLDRREYEQGFNLDYGRNRRTTQSRHLVHPAVWTFAGMLAGTDFI